MILAGVDTETTGLDQEKGHRIVEICFRLYDSVTRDLVDEYVQRINPQRSIDSKAQAVHHITATDLIGCPTWEEVAPKVASMMAKADLMVAHNMNFDGPFIALELVRVGVTVPNIKTLCTMKEGRWATPLGKNPNLGEVCFALGVDYDSSAAHAADYDVDVMMECLFRGVDRGFYHLPEIQARAAA